MLAGSGGGLVATFRDSASGIDAHGRPYMPRGTGLGTLCAGCGDAAFGLLPTCRWSVPALRATAVAGPVSTACGVTPIFVCTP
jgi:hypothetical protein